MEAVHTMCFCTHVGISNINFFNFFMFPTCVPTVGFSIVHCTVEPWLKTTLIRLIASSTGHFCNKDNFQDAKKRTVCNGC